MKYSLVITHTNGNIQKEEFDIANDFHLNQLLDLGRSVLGLSKLNEGNVYSVCIINKNENYYMTYRDIDYFHIERSKDD